MNSIGATSAAKPTARSATKPEATSFKQRLFRTRPEDVLPLTIEHQRIYILPTRRGLAYLFSLLIMLIAAVNYALSLGYALCFLLTGLFAASLLHTYRNVAGITCEKISSKDSFAGESAEFSIKVKNQSRLDRIGLTIKATDTSGVIDVQTENTENVVLIKATTERGVRKLGRLTITSTYPLGLWRCWCYVHGNAEAIVYPKPESTPPPLPALSVESAGEQSRLSTQGDISGLREYNPGDTLSSIAWKAAARGQGLFVKTFDDESSGGKTHFDLRSTGLHDLEQQLSRMAAWVLLAEKSRTEYSFELADTRLEPGFGSAQKRRALVALAKYGQPS